jgi:pimeloyl-ACP methyl ester carboxylesterase
MTPAQEFTVHVEGRELKILTQGSGPETFVLVPGIGVSPRYFAPLARELAAYGVVHSVELPGFGGTRAPRQALSMPDFARLVRGALDSAGIGPAVLVGHSMGCQITAEMTVSYPELTRALVLLGPTTNRKERNALQQGWRLFQDTLREPPQVNYVVLSDYARSSKRWYLTTVPEMVGHRLEETVAKINVPMLVLRGERDPIAPREWVAELGRACPSARIAEVQGEAHVAMFRRPRTVASYCLELAARA